ncbi:hypothetical protein KIN20_019524 [Parelaphostrongylus tenuis]|uniref:Uncharacterized protein n=1 Tax=Parelaphostrongylus tenuis TaxID=148309 RepID=A0AAD5MLE3_PARTN|nr:hypothetical protein KIN20_019524 [Parelaphostrongylus tenuis]
MAAQCDQVEVVERPTVKRRPPCHPNASYRLRNEYRSIVHKERKKCHTTMRIEENMSLVASWDHGEEKQLHLIFSVTVAPGELQFWSNGKTAVLIYYQPRRPMSS